MSTLTDEQIDTIRKSLIAAALPLEVLSTQISIQPGWDMPEDLQLAIKDAVSSIRDVVMEVSKLRSERNKPSAAAMRAVNELHKFQIPWAYNDEKLPKKLRVEALIIDSALMPLVDALNQLDLIYNKFGAAIDSGNKDYLKQVQEEMRKVARRMEEELE